MINNLLLRMKLSSGDPEVRLAALETIPTSDQETLTELALNDASANIRHLAALKLDKEELMEQVCDAEQDKEFKKILRNKLNRIYVGMLLEGKTISTRLLAKIDDEILLVTAACGAPSSEVRSQVAKFVKSDKGKLQILEDTDDIAFGTVLMAHFDNDETILSRLSESTKSTALRQLAEKKLKALQATETDTQVEDQLPQPKGIAAELKNKLRAYENIIAEIKRLSGNISMNAEERLAGLRKKWLELPKISPSFMEVLEIEFKQACEKFTEDIAGAKQRQKQRLLDIERLDEIYAEVVRIQTEKVVKREQFNRLVKEWEEISVGLDAIEPLQERWTKLRYELEERISEHQERLNESLEFLEKINTELAIQAKLEQPEITKERRIELEKEVSNLIEKFPDNHRVKTAKELFIALNKDIRRKLHDLYEVRDLGRWEQYSLKIVICEELEKLLEENDLHKVSRKFSEICKRWRNTGAPPREKMEEINARFRTTADEIAKRCDEFFAKLNQQRAIIAAAKEGLCAAAEELQNSTDWNSTTARFKEMQHQWREIGFAKPEQEKKLFARFRAAADQFFNARNASRDIEQQRRDQAAKEKLALCEEVEALSASNPGELLRNSKGFWNRWRSAGFSGRGDNELYERFKSFFDQIYDRRRQEHEDNLTEKITICLELNELHDQFAKNNDPKLLQEQFKKLEKRWTEVGPVAYEEDKSIFNEYKTVADKIKHHLNELRRDEFKNLIDQMERLTMAISKAWATTDLDAVQEVKNELETAPTELKWMDAELEQIIEALENKDPKVLENISNKQNKALETMKNICAELETINGVEAPTESSSAPDDMLVDLAAALQGGIGGFTGNPVISSRATPEELRQRWFTTGIPPHQEVAEIFARFRDSLKMT